MPAHESRMTNPYTKSAAGGRASHLSTVKSLGLLHDLQVLVGGDSWNVFKIPAFDESSLHNNDGC